MFKRRHHYDWLLIASIGIIKCILIGWAVSAIHYNNLPEKGIANAFNHWDSKAYLALAESGYDSNQVEEEYRRFLSHFPPLYPLLISAVSVVTSLSLESSAFLLSYIAGIFASLLLYELVLFDFKSRRTALLSVLFFNLYPAAYFMLAIYTESIFLLLTIGSFYLLRRGMSASAGILGFGAILTRLPGVTLGPVYLWDIFCNWKKSRNFWYLGFPALAVFIYLAINQYYYGDYLFFLHEYEGNPYSAKHLIFPFWEVIRDFNTALQQIFSGNWDHTFMMNQGWGSVFVLFMTGVTLFGMWKKIPLHYTIYSISMILFIASFSWGISNARYTLAVFPAFIILGMIRDKYVLALLFLVFSILLLYFARIFAIGGWAF